MAYKVDKLRLGKFFRHISQVYDFLKTIRSQKDTRKYCDVSIQSIFVGVFVCLLLRFSSFRRLSREVKRGQLWKFIPEDKSAFCANTIGYGLEHIDIDTLESQVNKC